MPRKLKKIIFWTQFKPDHISNPSPQSYPGIATAWDIHPSLDEWENELLWILNNDFDQKTKQANLAQMIQKKVRNWADKWIKNPNSQLFSKELSAALRNFLFQVEVTPASSQTNSNSSNLPSLSIKFYPKYKGKDPTSIWLFALAWTLSKVAPKGLGKCDICGNYFIDTQHRGKKRCSIRCSRLAATRKARQKRQI